ncbi:hypothetical protein TNCV_3770482 [Trichonephila clavipes]|nr:hypothetical protein TNCV_3770482 [Trichonephila clavipes]
MLDFHNQELIMDELVEMHEQEQDVEEESESSAPVQSEDRMTVGNLTEGLSLIEKGGVAEFDRQIQRGDNRQYGDDKSS